MHEEPDKELLRQYSEESCEAAFAAIVDRYSNLVYSAALRQSGSPEMARDISQNVFVDLARKAHPLSRGSGGSDSLAGWLYRSAHLEALDALRLERRRKCRERNLMDVPVDDSCAPPDWERLRPVLDEAMSALKDKDREALLLRFFKNREFHAIGEALGTTDDAAQKRVARSLEKLRAGLVRRGISTSAAALGALLSANAIEPFPAAARAALSSLPVAAAGIHSIHTGTFLNTLSIMTMSKVKLILGAGLAAGLAGYFIAERQSALELRRQNEFLTAQVARLKSANDDISGQSKLAGALQPLPDNQLRELARLRAEVSKLRGQIGGLQEEIKRTEAAKGPVDPKEREAAQFTQRRKDMTETAMVLSAGTRQYLLEHGNALPQSWSQVRIYFPAGTNFSNGVGWDEFEIVNVGIARYDTPDNIQFRERAPRRNPNDGLWERVYGMADGQIKSMSFANQEDFDAWEQQHSISYPVASSAPGATQ